MFFPTAKIRKNFGNFWALRGKNLYLRLHNKSKLNKMSENLNYISAVETIKTAILQFPKTPAKSFGAKVRWVSSANNSKRNFRD